MKIAYYILPAVSVLVFSVFVGNYYFSSGVDYNKDVKPILNKHCMGCHGGVKKAGNVSFLFEHEVFKPGKSGKVPVVRGEADKSEMILRIESHDPDERMPQKGAPLTKEEVQILKRWIDEGAQWDVHWAYTPIKRPEVPSVKTFSNLYGLLNRGDVDWVRNEIDHFILKKLNEKNLSHSPEADKATLLRRVSLDLTGLPPTQNELLDFERDNSKGAYEKVVDRLLHSPAFGERWAAMWMDLARYADTKGYESDGGRTIWRYRDYVIRSFNEDKPFDQFTIEQLAGDLLPVDKDGMPAREAMIATGFHRNTMINHEGGTDDEEFRVAAQIDRVNTTWEVWQGTTFGCVQCHSHPYDPIRHEEYYKYMAFFNNTRDEDIPTEYPALRFYPKEDSVRIRRIRDWIDRYDSKRTTEVVQFISVMEPRINAHDFVRGDHSTRWNVSFYGAQNNGTARLPSATLTGVDNLVISLSTRARKAVLSFSLDSLAGPKVARVVVPAADTVLIVPLAPTSGKHRLFLSVTSPETPDEWVVVNWVSLQKALPGAKEPGYALVLNDYASLLTRSPESTPVLWEGKGEMARKTQIFERGNWIVKGREVKPDVPKMLPALSKNEPGNRLGLARWIMSRENPLTARVLVNRFWEQLFGRGIVETVEDLGSQGSDPTHKELLDWLAVRFREDHHWSVKSLLREIVLSATYRQRSQTDEERQAKDPYNYWLSRGPRLRLSAEQVRDQALACSGLLSSKMYGPSVMPPQPDGVWQSPYNGENWVVSQGEDRYRRGVYTYWKRTAPYPSMITFDAPSREFCQSRRITTNTPLQALVTLNDPVYLEAAVKLALVMKQKSKIPQQQIAEGYRMLTFRKMNENSLKVAVRVYRDALAEYRKQPAAVDSLIKSGVQKTPELAALTVTANVLMNLDDVVTKE